MLNPYYRFVKAADVYTSPIDIKGNDTARKMFNEFNNWNKGLALADVAVKLNEAPKAANAFVRITYKNGWTNQYSLKEMNYEMVKQHMETYAKVVHRKLCVTKVDVFENDDEYDEYEMEAKTF